MMIPDLRACEEMALAVNHEILQQLEAAVEARRDYRLSYDEDLVTDEGFGVPRSQIPLTDVPLRVLQDYLRAPQLNQALGKNYGSTRRLESLRGLAPEVAALSSALAELRIYPGVVFRGAALPPAALERLKKSGIFWREGFFSASALYMQAQYYAVNRRHGDVPVVFVIANKSGRIIPNCLYHRNEFEVLFDRPAVFDVLKVDESRSPVHIYMQEADRAAVSRMPQNFLADLQRNSDGSWNRITGILDSSPGLEDEAYIENLSSLRRDFRPGLSERLRFDIERSVADEGSTYSWMIDLYFSANEKGPYDRLDLDSFVSFMSRQTDFRREEGRRGPLFVHRHSDFFVSWTRFQDGRGMLGLIQPRLNSSYEAAVADQLDRALEIMRALDPQSALSDEELQLSLDTARRSLEVVPLGFR